MRKQIIQDESISNIKNEIIPILKRNGVTKAGLFGSFARGEAKKNSDIDIEDFE